MCAHELVATSLGRARREDPRLGNDGSEPAAGPYCASTCAWHAPGLAGRMHASVPCSGRPCTKRVGYWLGAVHDEFRARTHARAYECVRVRARVRVRGRVRVRVCVHVRVRARVCVYV